LAEVLDDDGQIVRICISCPSTYDMKVYDPRLGRRRTAGEWLAEGKAQATAARDAATPASEATRESDSPDTVRLSRVLTTLTRSSTALVAATEKNDVTVTPTGGAKPVPATATPPR
jgi:hypothetical protein